MLAFAITIRKSQILSLKSAVMDAGPDATYCATRFDYAMAYAVPDPGGLRHVYECQGVAGKPAVGKGMLAAPPYRRKDLLLRYSSVVDHLHHPSFFAFHTYATYIHTYIHAFHT